MSPRCIRAFSTSRTSSSPLTSGARLSRRERRWGCSASMPWRLFSSKAGSRRTGSTRRPGGPDDERKSETPQSLSSKQRNPLAQQQFEDLNSGFIQELFEQYLASPESVP